MRRSTFGQGEWQGWGECKSQEFHCGNVKFEMPLDIQEEMSSRWLDTRVGNSEERSELDVLWSCKHMAGIQDHRPGWDHYKEKKEDWGTKEIGKEQLLWEDKIRSLWYQRSLEKEMFQQRIIERSNEVMGGKLACKNLAKWNYLVTFFIKSISVQWYSQKPDLSGLRSDCKGERRRQITWTTWRFCPEGDQRSL